MARLAGVGYAPWLLSVVFPGAGPLLVVSALAGALAIVLLFLCRTRQVALRARGLVLGGLVVSVMVSLLYFIAVPLLLTPGRVEIDLAAGPPSTLDDPVLLAHLVLPLLLLVSATLVSVLLAAALAGAGRAATRGAPGPGDTGPR
jgi:hypothetical protein